MNVWDQALLIAQLGRAALSWLRYNTGYPSPVPENPKFMSPRDAVSLIQDGDVVAVSGLAAQQRASVVYRAVREAFEKDGRPRDLTLVNVGGHGGRGRMPGTLEEMGRRGLCTRFITSHFETFQAMLDLAEKGDCELQCLPLGMIALLFDALGKGRDSVTSTTGVGTFLDPRLGPGSALNGGPGQFITAQKNRLAFRMPPIDVAVFNAPAADRAGNLYARNCAVVCESLELARAARRNGGRVIANVGLVVDEGYDEVFLPAGLVDAVVYYPDTEQTPAFFHRAHWPAVTTSSDVPIGEAFERVRFLNRVVGVTPRRSRADEAVARLAAATLLEDLSEGAIVSIGTGLSEEVARVVFESGLLGKVKFLVESGAIGGLPAPGMFFGAAVCPEEIVSSAEVFKRCYERLDATCLGALQVDGAGNVNVSKRGLSLRDYVGPGGFIDFTAAARTIVFVSAWMYRSRIDVAEGELRIVKRGAPKFVQQVDEVTFNGALALQAGKRVFYATPVGLFQLTDRGMELRKVMPGVDIRRDILEGTPMKVVLPDSGKVPRLPRSIVTGERFHLKLRR